MRIIRAELEDQEILQDIEMATSLSQGQMLDKSFVNMSKPIWSDESSEDASQRLGPLKRCGNPTMKRSYRTDYNLHIHNIDKFLHKHRNLPKSSVKILKARKNTTHYRLRIQVRA